jgi:hypothetical protein
MDSNLSGVQRLFNSYEQIEEVLPFAHRETGRGLESDEHFKNVKVAANRLRYLFGNGRFQARGMKLTQEILARVPNHALSWEYRKECLLLRQFRICFENEMAFCENLLLGDPKNNYAWSQRRFCIEHTLEFNPQSELVFLEKVNQQHPDCQPLWTYRFWLTSRYNLFVSEIAQTSQRISKDANNKHMWWYRGKLLLASRRFLDHEEDFCLEALRANPTSDIIWNHITEFFDSMKLYSTKLKETCLALIVDSGVHRHAVTALVFNELRRDPLEIDRPLLGQMVELLKEKLDPKKKAFWSYFLENCCGQVLQQVSET